MLKVIGAGFGRTGTHSLSKALEMLGFGPCYHVQEIGKNPGHYERWQDAIDGKAMDWDALYGSYVSAVEWPTVTFLPQLLTRYPQAKIILTWRDAETWYASARATIFDSLELSAFNPDEGKRMRSGLLRRLILEQTFAGKYGDKAYAIHIYEEHVQRVVQMVPPERLLQFHVADGWEPLCHFLGISMPEEPFPRVNDRNDWVESKPAWAKHLSSTVAGS
ncbi:MAG: sulfotransferase [Caldilineaceae bacterium]